VNRRAVYTQDLKPESVFWAQGRTRRINDVTDSDDESDLKQSKEVNTLSWLKNICHLEIQLEHN
jgi:hypothetical protein